MWWFPVAFHIRLPLTLSCLRVLLLSGPISHPRTNECPAQGTRYPALFNPVLQTKNKNVIKNDVSMRLAKYQKLVRFKIIYEWG
jgi:hypothetical protein